VLAEKKTTLPTQKEKVSGNRPQVWQIVTLVLPLVFAVVGMVAIYYDPSSRLFIVGLGVSLIFGFTLSTLARILEAKEKSDELGEYLELMSRKIDEVKAHSAVARSLTDQRLASNTNGLLDGVSLTSEIAQRFPAIAPFCDWKISQIEDAVRELVKQAEDGKVVIDDPARELTSSIELLRSASSEEVLAISYEDTPFWTSNEGKRFLDEHERAISRKVSITRIFIVESEDEKDLLPVIEAQHKLGVRVFKVAANDVRDLNPSDVVIYDGKLVRMGYNQDYTQSNKFKAAQLVVSPEIIRRQVQTFSALKARAELFEGAK